MNNIYIVGVNWKGLLPCEMRQKEKESLSKKGPKRKQNKNKIPKRKPNPQKPTPPSLSQIKNPKQTPKTLGPKQ